MATKDFLKCQKAIEARGALLVYPLQNRKEPPSLWGELYPRSEMRWEWDQGGDTRVSDLWRRREELARSGRVVYSKWFRGRATFFSRDCFVDLLRVVRAAERELSLRSEARDLYEALTESSPLSTKELKRAVGLVGKSFESHFQRGMKRLFEGGLIIGWGEVDDGAFPSLACGATKLMFEDLWAEGGDGDPGEARLRLAGAWAPSFVKFLDQIVSKTEGSIRT